MAANNPMFCKALFGGLGASPANPPATTVVATTSPAKKWVPNKRPAPPRWFGRPRGR
jgi:hypothetical protein